METNKQTLYSLDMRRNFLFFVFTFYGDFQMLFSDMHLFISFVSSISERLMINMLVYNGNFLKISYNLVI